MAGPTCGWVGWGQTDCGRVGFWGPCIMRGKLFYGSGIYSRSEGPGILDKTLKNLKAEKGKMITANWAN